MRILLLHVNFNPSLEGADARAAGMQKRQTIARHVPCEAIDVAVPTG